MNTPETKEAQLRERARTFSDFKLEKYIEYSTRALAGEQIRDYAEEAVRREGAEVSPERTDWVLRKMLEVMIDERARRRAN